MATAAKAASKLTAGVKAQSIKTWVRIRPLATAGEKGGHSDGERVEKE